MTGFKSNATQPSLSDSAAKSSKTTRSTRQAMLQLIPPYIREVCKKPKTAELRVNYDAPTLQTTYTYTITWDGNLEVAEKVLDLVSSRSSTSLTNLSGGVVPPVDAMCDGPCKRMFKSNLLSTIGRCGHYLCNACFGIVTNSDGTNGCSSINCYWKGGSREETKKFYEKEVCRKQRERARDMRARGIDVKVASNPSSMTNLTSPGPQTLDTLSMASASTLNSCPPNETPIKTKLVMLELSETGGMMHRFSSKRLPSTDKLLKALTKLIERKKLDALEMLARGTLYYSQERLDSERELYLIDRRDFGDLSLYHFPKVDGIVVFVLDLNDFVKNGREVYFE